MTAGDSTPLVSVCGSLSSLAKLLYLAERHRQGSGQPGQLWDSKEGLSWTEFQVPLQTVSWCCRQRAGLLQTHVGGQVCCLVCKRGGYLSSLSPEMETVAALLKPSPASWEVTQVVENLPGRTLAVTRRKITLRDVNLDQALGQWSNFLALHWFHMAQRQCDLRGCVLWSYTDNRSRALF